MRTPWISKSGTLTEDGILDVLKDFLSQKGQYYIALYADAFQSGFVQSGALLPALNDTRQLLELRVFDANRELWLHRTTLGQAFAWRIADDGALAQDCAAQGDAFLASPASYRMERRQKLDIDSTKPKRSNAGSDTGTDAPVCFDDFERRVLRATGGGEYTLPIGAKDAWLVLVDYIGYDESNGQATPADFRLVGFAETEGV